MDSPSEQRDGFSHAATAKLEVLEATGSQDLQFVD